MTDEFYACPLCGGESGTEIRDGEEICLDCGRPTKYKMYACWEPERIHSYWRDTR